MSGGIATIVFARFDSSRLPGKVLREIAGRPMLGRVLDRLRMAGRAGRIVVATSDRPTDDPVASYADTQGVACFRGDIDDVAGRALACAEDAGAARFVRISGDSPFIDPVLLDEMIALHETSGAEITTNLHPRSFPPGVSVEVIETATMRRMVGAIETDDEREHVTLGFYRNAESYRIVNHAARDDRFAGTTLVVDTAEDLRKATWITERLGASPESASLAQVVGLARQWQETAAGAAS